MENKRTIELTFIGNTTNAAYIDDAAACRVLIPDDAAFNVNGLNLYVETDNRRS